MSHPKMVRLSEYTNLSNAIDGSTVIVVQSRVEAMGLYSYFNNLFHLFLKG